MIGLSIGIVFLAVFLKRKTDTTGAEFCYLPNCRVLKELRSHPLQYSEAVARLMAAGQVDSATIARFLHDGDVDFGRSEPNGEPCKKYLIRGAFEGKQQELRVDLCGEEVIAESLQAAP